ncbi:MAG: MBOAT family O-acyltransferase, partial [Sphingomonadales bacterium]
LGTAKLFGFELLRNYRFPYFSRDIAEIWRRSQITLSSWFKDYLYIPLGGSRAGTQKAVRNTFIIFLVSGFWHGASWNFIVWGFIHACAFLPLLLLKRNRNNTDTVAQNATLPSLKELWQMITTFGIVTFAWIFFRADNLDSALGYLQGILSNWNNLGQVTGKSLLVLGASLLAIDWFLRHNERQLRVPNWQPFRFAIYFGMALAIWLKLGGEQSFLYFQF